jgi:hypothetical protein
MDEPGITLNKDMQARRQGHASAALSQDRCRPVVRLAILKLTTCIHEGRPETFGEIRNHPMNHGHITCSPRGADTRRVPEMYPSSMGDESRTGLTLKQGPALEARKFSTHCIADDLRAEGRV